MTKPDPNDEWTTVAEESAAVVIMDKVGDQFVGVYVGLATIVPPKGGDPFDQFQFRGTDGLLYALNSSYKLAEGMGKVQPGQMTRVTLVKEIDTGKGNPLKDYRIETK